MTIHTQTHTHILIHTQQTQHTQRMHSLGTLLAERNGSIINTLKGTTIITGISPVQKHDKAREERDRKREEGGGREVGRGRERWGRMGVAAQHPCIAWRYGLSPVYMYPSAQ